MKEKKFLLIGEFLIIILVTLCVYMIDSLYQSRLDYGFSLYYFISLAIYTVIIFYPTLIYWSNKIIKWCYKDK